MKVCMANKHGDWDVSKTGKGKFFGRLIPELRKLGVDVTTDPADKVDIDLQITRPVYWPENARKRVVRRGPVKYDVNMTWREHNVKEYKYMTQCHGIVYQSEFARKMNDDFLGKPRPGQKTAVILNGADPEYYANTTPDPSPYRFNVLASTREWVWEKRLKDVIKSFQLAAIPDSCLWIAGTVWDTPKRFPPKQEGFPQRYSCENIKFLGLQDEKHVAPLYCMADVLLHLVYVDACPNAVAEALCAGCRVVTTDAGGQYEMISPLTLSETEETWNRLFPNILRDPPVPSKPWNRRTPPPADRQAVADMLKWHSEHAIKRDWIVHHARTHLGIDVIAKKYAEFFEEVLK